MNKNNRKNTSSKLFSLDLNMGENPVPHEVIRKIKYGVIRGAVEPLEKSLKEGKELHGAHKVLFNPQIAVELHGKETVIQTQLDPRTLAIDPETDFPYAPTREEAALDVVQSVRDVLDHIIRYATWAEQLMLYTRARNWTAPFPERPVVNHWKKVVRYVFGDTWESVYQTLLESGAGSPAQTGDLTELEDPIESQIEPLEVAQDVLADPDPEPEADFGHMAEVAQDDPAVVEYTAEQFAREASWAAEHLPADHPVQNLAAMVERGDLSHEDGIKAIQELRA